MASADQDLEDQQYLQRIHRRHLTDAVLRQPLGQLSIPKPICVAPEATMQEVVEAMRSARVGVLLATSSVSGKLEGIFTERDLLLRVAGHGWNFREHRLDEVMTRNPECLTPDERVGFALHMMLTHGYRHIPLLETDGRPCGIVSQRFLLGYLCEYFPEDVLNQPPHSSLNAPLREQHGG